MNLITQRNRLEVQLNNYRDFVPFCPSSKLLPLLNEMIKIHFRIEKIKEYNLEELMKEVPFYFETKQSKINFKTI